MNAAGDALTSFAFLGIWFAASLTVAGAWCLACHLVRKRKRQRLLGRPDPLKRLNAELHAEVEHVLEKATRR